MPLAIVLAGCASSGSLQPITITAEQFRPLERAGQSFATERWAMDYYLRLDGRSASDVADQQVGSDPAGRADRILVFETDNYQDDSVRGEQWRIALDHTDLGYMVTSAGKRYKCQRGPNAGNWQRDLCP